jgi:hypothetical protein
MTFLRTGLIFIGGGVCGAGLAAAFFNLAPAQAPVLNALPPAAAEAETSVAGPVVGETRTVFAVTGEERAHIQSQMLEFLVDLQNLNSALAETDREWIKEIASAQSTRRAPDTIGQKLRKKAPEGFSKISQSLRSDFSALADAAETESIEELQERVSLVTGKCVACHGSYTVATQPAD